MNRPSSPNDISLVARFPRIFFPTERPFLQIYITENAMLNSIQILRREERKQHEFEYDALFKMVKIG
jgi:hypothetical protein